jgi:hypothetical protein
LLPDRGRCPACGAPLTWHTVLANSKSMPAQGWKRRPRAKLKPCGRKAADTSSQKSRAATDVPRKTKSRAVAKPRGGVTNTATAVRKAGRVLKEQSQGTARSTSQAAAASQAATASQADISSRQRHLRSTSQAATASAGVAPCKQVSQRSTCALKSAGNSCSGGHGAAVAMRRVTRVLEKPLRSTRGVQTIAAAASEVSDALESGQDPVMAGVSAATDSSSQRALFAAEGYREPYTFATAGDVGGHVKDVSAEVACEVSCVRNSAFKDAEGCPASCGGVGAEEDAAESGQQTSTALAGHHVPWAQGSGRWRRRLFAAEVQTQPGTASAAPALQHGSETGQKRQGGPGGDFMEVADKDVHFELSCDNGSASDGQPLHGGPFCSPAHHSRAAQAELCSSGRLVSPEVSCSADLSTQQCKACSCTSSTPRRSSSQGLLMDCVSTLPAAVEADAFQLPLWSPPPFEEVYGAYHSEDAAFRCSPMGSDVELEPMGPDRPCTLALCARKESAEQCLPSSGDGLSVDAADAIGEKIVEGGPERGVALEEALSLSPGASSHWGLLNASDRALLDAGECLQLFSPEAPHVLQGSGLVSPGKAQGTPPFEPSGGKAVKRPLTTPGTGQPLQLVASNAKSRAAEGAQVVANCSFAGQSASSPVLCKEAAGVACRCIGSARVSQRRAGDSFVEHMHTSNSVATVDVDREGLRRAVCCQAQTNSEAMALIESIGDLNITPSRFASLNVVDVCGRAGDLECGVQEEVVWGARPKGLGAHWTRAACLSREVLSATNTARKESGNRGIGRGARGRESAGFVDLTNT